jgi:transposase
VTTSDHLPDDIDGLKAALAEAQAKLSGAHALIQHLQLVIAKMRRERFAPRAERSERLIEQMELQLEELAAAAAEYAAKAETARVHVQGFMRQKAVRRAFPIICRGGASFIRRPRHVLAAAAPSCPRSAKTSPRRST